MKPTTAIKHAGSINALAQICECSRQVVQHWKRKGEIPDVRLAFLREKRPQWFKKVASK